MYSETSANEVAMSKSYWKSNKNIFKTSHRSNCIFTSSFSDLPITWIKAIGLTKAFQKHHYEKNMLNKYWKIFNWQSKLQQERKSNYLPLMQHVCKDWIHQIHASDGWQLLIPTEVQPTLASLIILPWFF